MDWTVSRAGSISGNAKAIQGHVQLDGGADSGVLYVYDTGNLAGSIVHIDGVTDTTIGGTVGDTLFGAGGLLRDSNIGDPSLNAYVDLELGSGPDTIYATPQATSSLLINAYNPLRARRYSQSRPCPNSESGGPKSRRRIGPVHEQQPQANSMDGNRNTELRLCGPDRFLVTNTLDSGPGSLRQAMLDANATPNVGGPDVIRFSIPGAGRTTIQPLSILPTITDAVVIDGTSQPGYAGAPVIELDGTHGRPISA